MHWIEPRLEIISGYKNNYCPSSKIFQIIKERSTTEVLMAYFMSLEMLKEFIMF